MSNVWAERFAQPPQELNLEYEGEILCLEVIRDSAVQVLGKVEKGDSLNGVQVVSCQEHAAGFIAYLATTKASKKFKAGGMIVHHKKVSQIQPKEPEYKCLTLLDEPYYRLAIRRSTVAINGENVNKAIDALFRFDQTPEGHAFWWTVMLGDKPELPELSKQELESEFVKPNIKS